MGKNIYAGTVMIAESFLDDKKLDGNLYGFLYTLAKKVSTGELALAKKDIPTKQSLCAHLGIRSPKTLTVHLNYLIQKGYITDERGYYFFPTLPEFSIRLPAATVSFLYDTCRPQVFKSYIWLGKRYKDSLQQKEEECFFNAGQLGEYLGLDVTKGGVDNRIIKNDLKLLSAIGLISYEEVQNNRWKLKGYYFVLKFQTQ